MPVGQNCFSRDPCRCSRTFLNRPGFVSGRLVHLTRSFATSDLSISRVAHVLPSRVYLGIVNLSDLAARLGLAVLALPEHNLLGAKSRPRVIGVRIPVPLWGLPEIVINVVTHLVNQYACDRLRGDRRATEIGVDVTYQRWTRLKSTKCGQSSMRTPGHPLSERRLARVRPLYLDTVR
jgi:hypothetical protein